MIVFIINFQESVEALLKNQLVSCWGIAMKKYLMLFVFCLLAHFPARADGKGIVFRNQTDYYLKVRFDKVEPGEIWLAVSPGQSLWFDSGRCTPKDFTIFKYASNKFDNEQVVVFRSPILDVETEIIDFYYKDGKFDVYRYSDVWNDFLNNIISHKAYHAKTF